jgi:hypothetical protein
MKIITLFCMALLGLGLTVAAGVQADDLTLPASISGVGVYATQNGAIITPQGGCVIQSGAKVTLVADSFSFGPGFEIQAGATLSTMKPTSGTLFDAWMIKWFGSNFTQGPYDDYDGDGLNNLAEYQLGTDPTNPNNKLSQLSSGPGTYNIYDALGRVIGVYRFSTIGFVYGIQYEYDANGNRTRSTVSVGR